MKLSSPQSFSNEAGAGVVATIGGRQFFSVTTI